MNKSTLLTAGLLTGIVVVLSYSFLGNDAELVQPQQPLKAKNVQIKEQPEPSSNKAKTVKVISDKTKELTASAAEKQAYERKAPPPPISSTKSTKVAHSNPQAHGHEETSDGQQRNAPPPPTGANQ